MIAGTDHHGAHNARSSGNAHNAKGERLFAAQQAVCTVTKSALGSSTHRAV